VITKCAGEAAGAAAATRSSALAVDALATQAHAYCNSWLT